jgi:hypothetical protein
MKYLILIYHNQNAFEAWAGMSDAERTTAIQAHTSLVRDLAGAGQLIASEALADASHGTRVQTSAGRLTTTDGPFPELKEHLAGFYLLDCDSIEQAICYAGRIPEAAAGGHVEVRQVIDRAGTRR